MSDRRGDSPLSSEAAWVAIMDVEYSHHFAAWFAIMQLESQDREPINSTNVRDEVEELTGDRRESRHVLLSMGRLRDTGLIGREERSRGYHWFTTELGCQVAAHMAAAWSELAAGIGACIDDNEDE